ncbi:MAG: ABC transporter permease subunit [Actinobacteria bacterium]|nr:ABC transporter permease subunit [Actinomycetota bacterium]MBO0836936.1 ABC transporter permease subunit [Actinomycetota bacterium]
MIWLSWRQYRSQAIVAAGALIVTAILLAATRNGLAALYNSAGLPACHANCATIASSFIDSIGSFDHILYFGSVALMYLAPALMGLFWGAPLIAREFEAGTHRVAWNQSVTRTRWTLVKLAVVGVAGMLTAGLLSLMVTWWASPIDHAAALSGGAVQVGQQAAAGGRATATFFVLARLEPVIFAARGVAPLGYAAFAFALGVAAGVLLRRTVAAMALTLVVFVVIQVVVPNAVRPHLLQPIHVTTPVSIRNVNFNTNAIAGRRPAIQLTEPFDKPGAWVLSNAIITPSGAQITVPPQACDVTPGSGLASVAECKRVLASMHLRHSVSYQPASRFWPLQWIETGVYLVLAAGLGWVCVWQVRRRRVA